MSCRLTLRSGVCLLMGALLGFSEAFAASGLSASKTLPLYAHMEVGQGFKTNVFLSDRDPEADSYTLLQGSLHTLLTPGRRSVLFFLLSGNHQQFAELDQSNQTFGSFAGNLQHFFRPSLGVGLLNFLTYTDLQLLDTEGNALPREQFRSLGDKVRLYGIVKPTGRLKFEAGGFYGFTDVKETEDQSSLDFKEYGGDFVSRLKVRAGLSLRGKYEYKVLFYDERLALNRETSFSGVVQPGNPRLRLRRHEAFSQLKYQGPCCEAELKAKIRVNDDRFENHLSYRQGELRGKFRLKDLKTFRLELELLYKMRAYTDRKRGLGALEKLREAFYVGDMKLSKSLWKWLRAYLRYEWTFKGSNEDAGDYRNHDTLMGVEATW